MDTLESSLQAPAHLFKCQADPLIERLIQRGLTNLTHMPDAGSRASSIVKFEKNGTCTVANAFSRASTCR